MNNYFDLQAINWDTPERIERSKKFSDILLSKFKLDKNLELLEIGTGTGTVSIFLSRYVKSILAIDNSKGMLEILEKKLNNLQIYNLKFLYFDIENNYLTLDKEFDLIFSILTFHHILNITKVLSNLYKLTKQNGKIVIIDLLEEDGSFHKDNISVKHQGFNPNRLKDILVNIGYKSVYSENIFSLKKVINNEVKDFPLFMLSASK